MAFYKLVIAKYFFYVVFISCCYPCRAGFFSNVKGFFLDTLGRRKFSDDESAVESSILLDPRDSSAEEIILSLTTGNEILRTQVSSLKSTVNTQKKKISELKKDKDVSRRLMAAQLEKFLEGQDDDRESIKRELRDVFEEEKIVMITSFGEEKRLLSEDYSSEIRDIKLELSQQLEVKRVELVVVSESNAQQSKQIEEYEKSQVDFSKDITDLKESLRAKDTAIEDLRVANSRLAENVPIVSPAVSVPSPKKAEKSVDSNPPPMRRSKQSKSSSSASKSGASSSNRPPIGGLNGTPGARGGL